MKIALIIALSVAAAVPAMVVPTASDAQVMTSRFRENGGSRSRPPLSERELRHLSEAQDQIFELTDQIAAIEAAGQTQGGLTPEQTTQLETHRAAMARAQETVDKLEAKRARREG
jgi:TolA-binding protein